MNLEEIRRKRAEVNAQIQLLATKEAEGSISSEEIEQFEKLATEIETMTASMTRLEKAESMAASAAQPITSFAAGSAAVHIKEEAEQYAGSSVARTVMAIAAGAGDLSLSAKFAQEELRDNNVSMAIQTTAGSGGALIPQNMLEETIELLRPRTIVRRLGAVSVPLPNGNLSMPSMSSGASSGYVGEGDDVNATESEFGDVKLSAKTMITLVPMSNQLIGRAGRNIETLVLNDMINSMAAREDKAFLRDDGTSNTPLGFKAAATAAGRVVAWAGTADLATIDTYLDSLILKLMESDSLLITPGWGLSPRTYMKLAGLRDGNGNKVYPELSLPVGKRNLKGWPVEFTTTIPVNLGAGTETEIYFADFNDVVIGEAENMTIDFSKEATYKDSSGNLVSAFARNQSLIRVVMEHDIGFRHIEGLVLGTKVTW
jgi:HK97 family phage major capsid protein